MKKNALILSAVLGLSILLSTPKAQAFTINKKMLGAAVVAVIIIAAILASKKDKGGDDNEVAYCDNDGCYNKAGKLISHHHNG